MLIYWMMFLVPVFMLFSPLRGTAGVRRLAWLAVGVLFAVIIGFRHEIGVDWFNYVSHYQATLDVAFLDALATNDPGYGALNWMSGLVGGNVYLVNFVSSALVMIGIVSFCRRQPQPWLAFLIAVPYMTIIVSMGYTRQSVAFGFELLALNALLDTRVRLFVFFVICGALFHKTAVILLPLALLVSSRGQRSTAVWVFVTGAILGAGLLMEHYETLWSRYVEAGMESDGGPIRIAMNALPSILFLLFSKRLAKEKERQLWIWMAILSLALVPLALISSAAADRIAIYFMPIQIVVFSRLYQLFRRSSVRAGVVLGVVFGYGAMLWVWLHFAVHSQYWLPYQFLPFV